MAAKVFKFRPDSPAGLEVAANAVRLAGNRDSFIYVDDSGVYIVGNMSILAEPQNIRVAGGYTFPTAHKASLPSTAVNPQAILESNSPVEGFTSIADWAAELLGELS